MEQFTLDNILKWINFPIFQIGQIPITLGGLSTAFLTIIVFVFLAAFVQRAVSNRLTRLLKLNAGTAYALARIIQYLIIIIGVIFASQMVGLNLGSLAVIFGFLSVGIGFGLQNVTSNFISGLILLFERPIAVDDFVTVEGQIGQVLKISMRATLIRTFDNVTIIVPNSKFIENQVINWSHGDTKVRIHCPVGVAYGSDASLVKETLLKVANDHDQILRRPAPDVRFIGFGDSALNFELLAWTDAPERQYQIRSQINFSIDKAFQENAIRIPFPQRDLHLQMTPAVEQIAGHGRV